MKREVLVYLFFILILVSGFAWVVASLWGWMDHRPEPPGFTGKSWTWWIVYLWLAGSVLGFVVNLMLLALGNRKRIDNRPAF